ncbi:MAG: hypothetical protein WBA76_10585 [Phormidesmis sp.]
MLRLPRRSVKTAVVIREQQKEEERMRDVEMLIESMFLREEVTLRLIADCLYDVGSVNLVNQRIQSPPLNWLMKAIARRSKPIFRFYMMRWSRKKCPHLIASWLKTQVVFEPSEVVLPEVMSPEKSALEELSEVRPMGQ